MEEKKNTRQAVRELLELKARFKEEGNKTWRQLSKELGISYTRIMLVARQEIDKMARIREEATE
jgi:L-2-hydroxyglutarate oxidase LhgO